MCEKFLVSTREKLASLIPKALSRTVKTEAKEQEIDRNQSLSHSIHIVGSYLLPILVCWDCYNKIPQTGWLLNNRNYSSQFWGLEIKDHGAEDSILGSSHFLPSSHLLCGLMWWDVQGKHSPVSFCPFLSG